MSEKYVNLYNYVNYRKYLGDYQKERYKTDTSFSRNKICQLLGLPNTRSYFRDVLGGKNLSKAFVERFIRAFELDKNEARYFRVLVAFTQSTSVEEREELFEKLIVLNQTPKRLIHSDAYSFYKEKHHSVVRASLDVFTIKENYKYLGARLVPPISGNMAKESLRLLKRLGMAGKGADGIWRQTDRNITAGFTGKNEMIRQYQLGKLEQGKRAMLKQPNEPHQTLTLTVSLSPETLKIVEKKAERFHCELIAIINKDEYPAKQVYQINLQYFPQSKLKKDDEC